LAAAGTHQISLLLFSSVFLLIKLFFLKEKFGYWLDRKNKMLIGWDNAPHHPELENFPHHKHINAKEIASYETSLESAMEVIRKLLQKK